MENLPNLTYLLHKQQITDNDEMNKQLPQPNMFTFHQHNTHGKPEISGIFSVNLSALQLLTKLNEWKIANIFWFVCTFDWKTVVQLQFCERKLDAFDVITSCLMFSVKNSEYCWQASSYNLE